MIQRRKQTDVGVKRAEINVSDIRVIDYKNTELLKRFTDSYGRITSKRRSKLSAKQQREIALAIKRARFLALLPFVAR
ncbi:MAG: 30S ribosomal protein S18 [Candidatus Vogelbacteria bacterium CG10_big_fil_rev_8_21_14_0_10_45_14]|uniref:Small ribosomal subunit protein bS18 n=1 Tax=Candidatus Vogelbacteria bacterium CG10_big_fil_rev_8_21_14_0_10_45_14 TaxID=1975042 RepID=A0A2H0RJ95_9BACT|nr:MAG: 30S ribosomal protein S18 [Candidatus Vogelbacteria bacterium CG10_big_fil_rev_8_21_14_0_10_45_14]